MKKIISVISIAALLFACNNQEKKAESTAAEVKSDKPAPPVELIADSNFTVLTKAAMAAFEKKDVEGYTANMDDNIKFRWSNGDSLVGKQAVKDYYAGRFKIIDTITLTMPIFLPVQANQSPNGVIPAGKWMLDWYMVTVKYTNGKQIRFWSHNAQHYNDAGKIDESTQYIDMNPIKEATKGLVK